MRRVPSFHVSRIALAVAGLALLALPTAVPTAAQEAAKAKTPLDGAWRLVSVKDQASGETRSLPDGIEMTKLVVGGRFAWTVVRDGQVVAGAGGRYAVEDDSYTETVTYAAGEGQKPLVGRSFRLTWKIEDGKWHHKGTLKLDGAEQPIDEIWERVPER